MIYFISGLGADERVFQFLNIADHSFKHIKWVDTQRSESITDYATRLTPQIDLTQEIILIGVSFGGLIAQEIAQILDCQKVIIISSVKSPDEFDWKLKLARKTKVHRFVPSMLFKWGNALTANYFFSVGSKEESKLLKAIVHDTNLDFMVWAIDAIMRWKKPELSTPIVHIHGTKDRIFPFKPIKNAHLIDRGGHFMIVNKAKEVSQLILNAIS